MAAYNGRVHDTKPNRVASSLHLLPLESSKAYEDNSVVWVQARAKVSVLV